MQFNIKDLNKSHWILVAIISILLIAIIVLVVIVSSKGQAYQQNDSNDEFVEIMKTYVDSLHVRSVRKQEELHRVIKLLQEEIKIQNDERETYRNGILNGIERIAKLKEDNEKPTNYRDSTISSIIDRLRTD